MPFCVLYSRLEERLKAVDHEAEIMEDWREKCTILKTAMEAAEEKIRQAKNAKSPEEIESCYRKLKVCNHLM